VLFNQAERSIEASDGKGTNVRHNLVAASIGGSDQRIKDIRIFFLLDSFFGLNLGSIYDVNLMLFLHP